MERTVEHNRLALVAIVAELCHYAGFGGAAAATLPRLVRNAVLRLLRPAEAAARRLIVAMAATMTVPDAQPPISPLEAPTLGSRPVARPVLRTSPQAGRSVRCLPTFPLFDPLRRFDRHVRGRSAGLPRISLPGVLDRHPLPAKPSASDAVAAARLRRRLAALKCALDDLPGQANRLVRHKVRAEARRRSFKAAGDPDRQGRRPFRATGLRPGKPPGYRARPRHAVDGVLAECHALACSALNKPDTS
ncbi:MAG: hypothetical protein R3D45_08950 [Rhizobiaceae bacterium]